MSWGRGQALGVLIYCCAAITLLCHSTLKWKNSTITDVFMSVCMIIPKPKINFFLNKEWQAQRGLWTIACTMHMEANIVTSPNYTFMDFRVMCMFPHCALCNDSSWSLCTLNFVKIWVHRVTSTYVEMHQIKKNLFKSWKFVWNYWKWILPQHCNIIHKRYSDFGIEAALFLEILLKRLTHLESCFPVCAVLVAQG